MKMHETEILETVQHPALGGLKPLPRLTRTRVAGGWVYSTLDYFMTDETLGVHKGVVFVPMHFEGAEEQK